MEKMALDAAQTPTTLWFAKNPEKAQEELDTVVACGQFTMCFTLLRLIEEISNRQNKTLSPEIEEVRQRAQAAWELLKENPQIWVGKNRAQAIAAWNKKE